MNMRYAKRSEDTEQINVVSWAGWNMNRYPELKWLFHVPNGGSRNKQEAVKFKQMGVKAGVSDLCLPYPKGSYCGLFVEMKFGNNRQQDTQKEFLADMAAAGHFVATFYSAEEAIKVIEFVGCGTHGEKSEHEHPEQQHPQGRENQELRRKAMKVLIALGIAAVVMLAMVFLAVILFVAAVAVDIASEFMD